MPRQRAIIGSGQAYQGRGGGLLTRPALRRIGTNMADNVYYNPARPFTNQAQLIAPFVVGTIATWDTGGTVSTDANGFPTGFSAPVVCNTVIILYGGHPNGTWTLTWDGPDNAITVDGATNNATSCVFTKSTTTQQFIVRFRVGGVTAVRIYHSADNPADTFTPLFIEKCQRYSILRTMNWCNPNYVWTPDWATRKTPASYTQSRKSVAGQQEGGMAWEYVAQLANTAKRDIWVCMHHLASDSYIQQVAQLLHANLQAGIRVYTEFSNETWNSGFPAHAYCQSQGDVSDPDPIRRGYIYAMNRAAAVGNIFKTHMPGRVVKCVWGVQSSGGVSFMDYSEDEIDPDSLDAIDVISPAPYFGGYVASTNALRDAIHTAWSTSSAAAVNEIFAQIDTHLAAVGGPYDQMTEWCERSDSLGKEMIAYEGGQHLALRGVDHAGYAATVGEAMILANRDPRMGDRYDAYLEEWHTRSGGQIMIHYTDVFTPQQLYGSWGAQEYEGESPTTAHKEASIRNFLTLLQGVEGGGSGGAPAWLREDGGYWLREDGGKWLLG